MDQPSRDLARSSLELSISLATQVLGIFEGLTNTLRYKHAVRYLYQPRADDLFIVAYPKSGTTMMQMMLYQIASDGSTEIPHINSVAPWFAQRLLRGKSHLLESLPSPRFFKSHLLHGDIPKGKKSIYILRDIRD